VGSAHRGPRFGAVSRRAVLRAALATAVTTPVAGCDLLGGKPEQTPSPDPLTPMINAARDLAGRYDAAVTAFPELAERLNPIAEAHRAHAAELRRVVAASAGTPGASETAPVVAALPGDVATALAELRKAEQQAHEEAVHACLAAPSERAALLGSIAAARAAHLEVLR
jgi:hypothetical protein